MIPWRLRFSGIRDYPATELDFSAKNEHILISGPNGAGKSTITFCMGAVLYSSKVAIDGLKSSNLASDQTWRAKIELLFKNDADIKIDAPLYVQFRLDIEQKPGEPIKREFFIEEGDVADEWERSSKFSSGGKLNFTEYKNQVLYKYAVDPDAFYLIWYQKEVNQFAIMHPSERFRIFSEMNGIDKIQKNWEESKELVKETELTLREAESKQGLNKLQLKQKKAELDRYHDRNRRLEEGFKAYGNALKWLEDYHVKQIDRLKGQIEELHATKQETIDHKRSLEARASDQQIKQETFNKQLTELNEGNQKLERVLEELGLQLKDQQAKRDAISSEIDQITKEVDRIDMSRKEVEQGLSDAEKETESLAKSIKAKEAQSKTIEEQVNQELNQAIAELNEQIKQDQDRFNEVRDLIDTYQSSATVQAEMDDNNRQLDQYKNSLLKLRVKETDLTKELGYLRKNQVVSPRQEASLAAFKKQNIPVYPLRELLELDESAKATDEQLFDTIKYTIFVNKKNFRAPNDLYHVSLPNIIPDQTLTHLPEQHIKVKAGLTGDHYAYAVKALWWTRSFFEGKEPAIDHGQLLDHRGIRGPQEDKRLILSEKMIHVYRQNVEKELAETKAMIADAKDQINTLDNKNSLLFGRRESLKEAEAFLTKENERALRQEKHRKLLDQRDKLFEQRRKLQAQLNQERTSQAKWQEKVNIYRKYQATYHLYEQEQEKIEEVQQLDLQIRQLRQERQKSKQELNNLNELLDKQIRSERQLNREIAELEDRLGSLDRAIDQIKGQLQDRAEERVTSEESYARTKQELDTLQGSASYSLEDNLLDLTRPKAEEMRERGKTIYDQAAHESGIDEAAPENYRKMKEGYDQSANEVKKSTILLDEYRERMERFKEDLEDTINMQIIGVNQKFVHYMSLFNFEGKIEWDYMVDRHGQTHYRLYIKARKEGHRSKLEDVSEKARGGKVGKGVSGGEESLSSLLFALALLQTINASPGYIVLDEFDSALDEGRKDKVFELYEQELKRKMIIITPKSHEKEYLYRFSKAYIVYHDPTVPKSKIFKVKREQH